MKAIFPLTAATCCLSSQLFAGIDQEIPLGQQQEAQDKEIPIGIEAVTGFRSDYVYRGFELADSTLDFQVETELALNKDTSLNLGAWYATETGQGNFEEAAFFTRLQFRKSDQLTIGLGANYRTFDHPVFKDGFDLGAFASWKFTDDLSATTGAYYDTGADGWYGHVETQWSKPLTGSAFISIKTGVSYVDDYYGRDGINDAYGRLSLTYHISDNVSVTPFVGGSVLLDSDDAGDDTAYGGVWFVVRF